MSAPPPPGTSTKAPGNGPPVKVVRKPKPFDPFAPRKKPTPRPVGARPVGQNGVLKRPAAPINAYTPPVKEYNRAELQQQRAKNGGFSEPPLSTEYTDYPLTTTKRALLEGRHHHIMRLARPPWNRNGPLDPRDQTQFVRPVQLHRRDPSRPHPANKAADDAVALAAGGRLPSDSPEPSAEAEAEAERQAKLKAEQEAQREANLAQIAPGVGDTAASRKAKEASKKKEKVTEVRIRSSAAAQAAYELRYQEAIPWHLEGADGKQIWQGTYEDRQEKFVALVVVNDALSGGKFEMLPLEKYYRFNAKPKHRVLTMEEAMQLMAKKEKEPRWVMQDSKDKEVADAWAATRQQLGGRARVKQETGTFRNASRAEKEDHDELDYEDNDFQDDDENVGLEPEQDEDVKESNTKMRRNQMGANLFGMGDEDEVDQEEKVLKKEQDLLKKRSKALKEALRAREGNYVESDSDSEDNPFSSDSESDEDNVKKEESDEGINAALGKDAKPQSGASTKGTNTPSGRASKHPADPGSAARKGTGAKNNLKRRGSPGLSESSGNESGARKKAKKGAVPGTLGAGTLGRGSRSVTPLPGGAGAGAAAAGKKKSGVRGGNMSDGEQTGGEGSDGGGVAAARLKSKLNKVTGARQTPTGSRAGSPAPGGIGAGSGSASPPRGPGSPLGRQGSVPPGAREGPVQLWEIEALVPKGDEGFPMADLTASFGGRLNGDARRTFIRLVKENFDLNPTTKKLVRRR